MRELRSTGNAFFWFALFLLGYALVVPPPEGTGRGRRPRFLRMVIEESGTPGHTEKVNITVPVVPLPERPPRRLGRKAGARGEPPLRRHRDRRDRPRGLEGALRKARGDRRRESPRGQRAHLPQGEGRDPPDGEGRVLGEEDGPPREIVTIRFPARFMEAAVSGDRDLDIQALFEEMKQASPRRRHRGDERRRPREGRHRLNGGDTRWLPPVPAPIEAPGAPRGGAEGAAGRLVASLPDPSQSRSNGSRSSVSTRRSRRRRLGPKATRISPFSQRTSRTSSESSGGRTVERLRTTTRSSG